MMRYVVMGLALMLVACGGEEYPTLTQAEVDEAVSYGRACMDQNRDRKQCKDACDQEFDAGPLRGDEAWRMSSQWLQCDREVHRLYVRGS